MANVFRMARPSVSYVASVANPPIGTRGMSSMRRSRRRRGGGSSRSKGGVSPPGRSLLGSRSEFAIS